MKTTCNQLRECNSNYAATILFLQFPDNAKETRDNYIIMHQLQMKINFIASVFSLTCCFINVSIDNHTIISGIQSWLRKCETINEHALSSDDVKIQQLLLYPHSNMSIRSCLLSNLLSMDESELKDQVK